MRKFLIVLILLCAFPVSGQSIEEKIETFTKPKLFRFNYDRFKDLTVIKTRLLNTKSKVRLTKPSVSVGISFNGKEPDGNVNYILGMVRSPLRGDPPRTIIILADEVRIVRERIIETPEEILPREFWRGTTNDLYNDYYVKATFLLSREEFDRISGSKKIEFQYDEIEGSFDDDFKAAITNLLSLVQSKTPK